MGFPDFMLLLLLLLGESRGDWRVVAVAEGSVIDSRVRINGVFILMI